MRNCQKRGFQNFYTNLLHHLAILKGNKIALTNVNIVTGGPYSIEGLSGNQIFENQINKTKVIKDKRERKIACQNSGVLKYCFVLCTSNDPSQVQ